MSSVAVAVSEAEIFEREFREYVEFRRSCMIEPPSGLMRDLLENVWRHQFKALQEQRHNLGEGVGYFPSPSYAKLVREA